MICSKDSLVHGMAAASCLILTLSMILIILGSILVGKSTYHELLGTNIKHIGGGTIFLAFLYTVPAFLGIYSARYHNKFLLLLYMTSLIILLFLQLLMGGLALHSSIPSFSYDFQKSCLSKLELENNKTVQKCETYYKSDMYAGLTIAWTAFYEAGLKDSANIDSIRQLQRQNFCCGLGPPIHCLNDSRKYPNGYDINSISINKRKICNMKESYYKTLPDCNINGICPFDLPIGGCGSNGVTISSKGCADKFYKKYASQVLTIGSVYLVSSILPIIFIIMSFCLCMKRKDVDVLPPLEFAIKKSIQSSINKVYITKEDI